MVHCTYIAISSLVGRRVSSIHKIGARFECTVCSGTFGHFGILTAVLDWFV